MQTHSHSNSMTPAGFGDYGEGRAHVRSDSVASYDSTGSAVEYSGVEYCGIEYTEVKQSLVQPSIVMQ